jgi:hypothetical protein
MLHARMITWDLGRTKWNCGFRRVLWLSFNFVILFTVVIVLLMMIVIIMANTQYNNKNILHVR